MFALRLNPGEEIKSCLVDFCANYKLQSAYIATCVGSVSSVRLRLANAERDRPNEIICVDDKRFEITSLVGSISQDGVHLHVGLADAKGDFLGGHLLSATVFTTAEVVIGNVVGVRFRRVYDVQTGFDELRVDQDSRGMLGRAVLIAITGAALILSGLFILKGSLRRR